MTSNVIGEVARHAAQMVLLIFIDSGFINFAVDDEWKELLKMLLITITAAYFGGRSYEKGKSIK